MLFINMEDFFSKANEALYIDREEEKALAARITNGDEEAKEILLKSSLRLVAAMVRRAPENIRTLQTVYACMAVAQKGVETYDPQKSNQPLSRYLSWRLRQCVTRCIADHT